MADKAISELVSAEQITPTDMFVLEQNGTAKKLTGQVLLNWLTAAADGHGGIQSIVKKSTSGLVDTYRITLADTTTFDFLVTNGKSINTITKESTSGLVDTYRITFNDNTSQTYTVTNGAKGDKGDNAYIWVKYASQEPSAGSSSFGDLPDDWMGVYFGTASTAPTDWQQYKWYRIKGEKGDTGEPATVTSNVVEYQAGDSGTIIPSGSWSSSVPVVAQGRYLWTRTTTTFNSGSPAVSYSVSRMGLDGSGSVSSVANISPDENGNVPLTAENVGALPNTGGDLTGELRMNGQPIRGLNNPTANDHAANMGFVNQQVKKAAPRNILDNSDWRVKNLIINQRNGYYAKSGATYYSDTGLTIAQSALSAATPANYVNKTYGSVDVSGTTYYVKHADMVEGYALAPWVYCIDRWRSYNKDVALNIVSNGIEFTNAIYQPIHADTAAKYNGKKITLAAKIGGAIYCASGTVNQKGAYNQVLYTDTAYGSIFVTCENNNYLFVVLNNTQKALVEWVALYEGEYTEDTLPEYQPKGYGAELAECQRYYRYFRKYMTAATTYADSKAVLFTPPVFGTMRSDTPTVNISEIAWIRGADSNVTTIPNYTASNYSASYTNPTISIMFESKIAITNLTNCMAVITFDLSADL